MPTLQEILDTAEALGQERRELFIRFDDNLCAIKHKSTQFIILDDMAVFIFSDDLSDYGRSVGFGPHKFEWHCQNRGFRMDMEVRCIADGKLVTPKITTGPASTWPGALDAIILDCGSSKN